MLGMVNDEPLAETQVPKVLAAPEKLALGAAAELLIASRIALLGYQVWSVPAKVATAIKRRVRICL